MNNVQRLQILIADDRARSRAGLRALLTTWPQVGEITEAVDGQEAVEKVAQCPPDVVLMDVRMPGMDGLEAARLIKDQWPQVRIIMLTMYPIHRTEAFAAGADAFLIKGGPAERLMEAVLEQA